MKRKQLVMIRSLLFVVVVSILVMYLYVHYRDIRETIQKGDAYGFTIGETKESVFRKIVEMAVQQKVQWITVYKGQEFRSVAEVEEDFSDWQEWDILAPEGHEIHLSFINQSLDLVREFRGYGRAVIPLSSWPQSKGTIPQIKPGMSYAEIYQILVQLRSRHTFKNIMVKPKAYKQITLFSKEDFLRLKAQNEWHVDLYPLPYGENRNYLYFRFEQGSLKEIIRRKDVPSLLDDILNIVSRASNASRNEE